MFRIKNIASRPVKYCFQPQITKGIGPIEQSGDALSPGSSQTPPAVNDSTVFHSHESVRVRLVGPIAMLLVMANIARTARHRVPRELISNRSISGPGLALRTVERLLTGGMFT